MLAIWQIINAIYSKNRAISIYTYKTSAIV